MNKLILYLKNNPPLYYLIVFLLMIVPALLLFMAAGRDSEAGMLILLGLVVLVNLSNIFF